MPMHVIGLDIGGTKTVGGIVSLPAGDVLARRAVPTRPDRSGETVLEDVVALARELCGEAAGLGIEIKGIGAGVAELVDRSGKVTSGQTIRWRGLAVREKLSELAPAVVESDVRAAALAEATLGAGRPFRLFVYVTVGTGISCCLVQEGKPYAGARGGALVFASSPLTTTCTECGAELRPVLEDFASGPALTRRFNQHAATRAENCEAVLAAAESGDRTAFEVIRSGAEALGVSVAWLINTLDPEAVIVGGGLGVAGGVYWDHFAASTRRHIWAEAALGLSLQRASLGADAGLIGAACAFRLHQAQGESGEARQAPADGAKLAPHPRS
jgi:glucokinase